MVLPYVCTRCSRQAARAVANVSKQLRYQSSTSSVDALLNDTDRDRVSSTLARGSRPATRGNNGEDGELAGRAHDGLFKRSQSAAPIRQPEELLSYISPRHRTPQNRPPVTTRPRTQRNDHGADFSAASLQPSHKELRDLIEQNELEDAWDCFEKNFGSRSFTSMVQSSFQELVDPQRRVVFDRLLVELSKAWLRPIYDKSAKRDGIPLPMDALNRYRENDIATPELHQRLIWIYASHLQLAMSRDANIFDSERAREAMDELIVLWSQWFQGGSISQDKSEFTDLDVRYRLLPQETTKPRKSRLRSSSLPTVSNNLHMLVPAFRHMKATKSPHGANAIFCTQDLLLQTRDRVKEFSLYKPFVTDVQKILLDSTLNADAVRSLKTNLMYGGMEEAATNLLVDRISKQCGTVDPAVATLTEIEIGPEPIDIVAERCLTRLGRALDTQNLDRAEVLFNEASPWLQSEEVRLANSPDVMAVYEHFMSTFLALRKPDNALVIWNTMIQNGYNPTVQTWTVMMRGCHVSRAPAELEEMWQRMRRSGLQPDAHAWSTRIFGLLRGNRTQIGLRALDEMGKDWQREMNSTPASRKTSIANETIGGHTNGVPKPSITIVNSALSALASQRSAHIGRVLAWSRQFDIKPNVITYNILINVALAGQQPDEADQILQRMGTTGVQPDSATFTILLNSLFRNSDLTSLSHEEQTTRIVDFINSVESSGVRIDAKLYALIIDRLIKDCDNIDGAIKALSHMVSHDVEPTAHIHTILMTYYFQADPPDLNAVDALWNQITSRKHYAGSLDTIFYDRMVEGFASNRHMGKMMSFLTRMSKEGKRPGWLALVAVLQCLAEHGDTDRIAQIVRDVQREEGLLRVGVRGTKGQAEFWDLVRELGVKI